MEFVPGEASTARPASARPASAETTTGGAAGKAGKKGAKKEVLEPQAHVWPPELTMPAPPRFPRALSVDRFRDSQQPRFGDDVKLAEDTRPLPNLVFSNGHAQPGCTLSPRLQLPSSIYFYVHVKFQRVSFPFPPGISTKQYLHAAPLQSSGGEFAGITLPFDERHVIGLCKHHLQSFVQLVLVVPSTATVNPRLRPTKLSFHPRHNAQLHRGVDGGAERSSALPRLIVPVWPVSLSRGAAKGRDAWMPAPRKPPRWGTFGTSDGRMGPAFLPAPPEGAAYSRAAAISAAAEFAAVRAANAPLRKRRPHAHRAQPEEAAPQEMTNEEIDILLRAERPGRVMRPSFIMA